MEVSEVCSESARSQTVVEKSSEALSQMTLSQQQSSSSSSVSERSVREVREVRDEQQQQLETAAEGVVVGNVAPVVTTQAEPKIDCAQLKQENLNNTIKKIISDIDREIEQQVDFGHISAQQQLLKQQQMLAQKIAQQQKGQLTSQQRQPGDSERTADGPTANTADARESATTIPTTMTRIATTNEQSSHNYKESHDAEEFYSKKIDLQKIFTPATDAEEILPKNRKLYASSAFYSPTLHPTVEDQVELARRISHSLSDISNKQSKGQSMYVNRKKRSVKWVHEGPQEKGECEEDDKENNDYNNDDKFNATNGGGADGPLPLPKVTLKLVMNPRGQVRDFHSVPESLNPETGLMSPDTCAELVTALNAQKGKGAELFAKRRKKAEKWVVDETNAGAQSPSGLPDAHQYQPRPSVTPNAAPSVVLPAYSDAGRHRVQLNMQQQQQLLDRYANSGGLQLVKTPWEAALETGSASTAFIETGKRSPYSPQLTPTLTISPAPAPQYIGAGSEASSYVQQRQQQQQQLRQEQQQRSYNSQRDLAYRPNIPQGWNAPSMTLPKELYVPKDIPLESYAPPPPLSPALYSAPLDGAPHYILPAKPNISLPPYVSVPQSQPSRFSSSSVGAHTQKQQSFPLLGSKPLADEGVPRVHYAAPKQLHLPADSYRTVAQATGHVAPPLNFSPSPLPYEKLAKFVTPPPPNDSTGTRCVYSPQYLGSGGVNMRYRNASPVAETHIYGNSTSCASRPPSQQQSFHAPLPGATAADLLCAQNFNSAPRGWRAPNPAHCVTSHKRMMPSITSVGGLPYTDF